MRVYIIYKSARREAAKAKSDQRVDSKVMIKSIRNVIVRIPLVGSPFGGR